MDRSMHPAWSGGLSEIFRGPVGFSDRMQLLEPTTNLPFRDSFVSSQG